jgi:gluconate kinase
MNVEKELRPMKDVIILVGEMGSGKTYWGKEMSRVMQADFFDGDDVIPPGMKDIVSKFRPLTKAMVDDYVASYLAPAILLERNKSSKEYLIVSQALYLKEHRDSLETYLEQNGIKVAYWYIWVPFWQNIRQLWSRPNGLRWILYWLMNKPYFQKEGLYCPDDQ